MNSHCSEALIAHNNHFVTDSEAVQAFAYELNQNSDLFLLLYLFLSWSEQYNI